MTKEEVVRLVSRALAAIQFVTALEEMTYLPSRIFSAHHYSGGVGSSYLETSYRLDVSLLFSRIVGLLILAWLFWACGPWITRLFLPPTDPAQDMKPEDAAEAPARG